MQLSALIQAADSLRTSVCPTPMVTQPLDHAESLHLMDGRGTCHASAVCRAVQVQCRDGALAACKAARRRGPLRRRGRGSERPTLLLAAVHSGGAVEGASDRPFSSPRSTQAARSRERAIDPSPRRGPLRRRGRGSERPTLLLAAARSGGELLDHHDLLEALLHDRVRRRGTRGNADARGAAERQEVLLDLDEGGGGTGRQPRSAPGGEGGIQAVSNRRRPPAARPP